MLDKILQLNKGNNSVSEFCTLTRQGMPLAIFGVSDVFKNYLVSCAYDKVLYIVKDNLTANLAKEQISEFSNKNVVFIPSSDRALVYSKAFSKDSAYDRITALYSAKEADVIIVTPESLDEICPNQIDSLVLTKDLETDQHEFSKKLIELGYRRVDTVSSKGSFALRGDILDVYPINTDNAYRIDFFGDVVENIKQYDVETRENLGYVQTLTILQALEWTFAYDNLTELTIIVKNEIKNAKKEQKTRLQVVAEDIESALETGDCEYLNPLAPLSKRAGDIFSFVGKEWLIAIDEPKRVYEIYQLLQREFTERYHSLVTEGEVFSFAIDSFISLTQIESLISRNKNCALSTLSTAIPFFNPLKIINPQTSGVVNYQLDFKEVFTDIESWLRSGYTITVFTGDQKRADNFSFELSERGIASTVQSSRHDTGIDIRLEKVSQGFIFHEEKKVVIGVNNLYSKPLSSKKLKIKKKGFFTAPEVGDYCVHETHGIGRVLGNKKISTTEGTKDYVSVEYSGGDLLYVPVEQMDILTRYLGSEKKPKLSKIGGKDFERLKRNVKESIKKMSFDLKQLYAERNQVNGFKFPKDDELQEVFENSFPFEDTVDQARTSQEIKEDMTSAKVMDRLVCGDVGFGKTEVALRAVFRAIVAGKQAVMLAPTTILTEQHYNTAKERFSEFGVKIACLNRFKTKAQQIKILSDLKEGKIDFIIGTHRLLSKDVEFKDLGLLVLDEEQRFGVEHKEKIKLLKNNVDTITLTATPIPRTLHMSLSGIRSISTINTPPKKRLPVQVYVTEETEALIKDAVTKEINRGGQAFIMYNRVESIFTFAERIKAIMPGIKLTVVHGQMEERVMERNILGFYNGEYDLLISTTIIENGIDLPKANTLIVIDADRLGLSTLYQLKGRVGRSDRLAYAYFTFKREKILTDSAYERLNAIIEFTEMGSGIKIAMRDLEIRGAGNILGAEQHGHMDKIGYELYSKLLREELSGEEEIVPELDIRVSAFIPEDYVESNVARMDVYKEIAEVTTVDESKVLYTSLEDAYGPVPEQTENLIRISIVKRLAMKIKVNKIVLNRERVALIFTDFTAFNNPNLQCALDKFDKQAIVSMAKEPAVEFKREGQSNEQMLSVIREFLLGAQ